MKNVKTKIFSLIFLAGVGIALYPVISNALADREHTSAIRRYEDVVKEIPVKDLEAEWEKAVLYNKSLAGEVIEDPFIPGSGMVQPDNYEEVLNVDEDGVLGYLELPSIDVYLPIYHGVSEKVLENGVGHMVNTAFPIGGEKTHAVLAAHRGLSSAKLFTDLDKMAKGDSIIIRVLNREITYEVDQIMVIEPDDTSSLQPTEGKEYVTLLTCTPYGINSHRLLVRGYKVDEQVIGETEAIEETEENMEPEETSYWYLYALIPVPFVVILSVILWRKWKKRRKKTE